MYGVIPSAGLLVGSGLATRRGPRPRTSLTHIGVDQSHDDDQSTHKAHATAQDSARARRAVHVSWLRCALVPLMCIRDPRPSSPSASPSPALNQVLSQNNEQAEAPTCDILHNVLSPIRPTSVYGRDAQPPATAARDASLRLLPACAPRASFVLASCTPLQDSPSGSALTQPRAHATA